MQDVKSESRYNRMIYGSIPKVILSMGIPAIISQVISSVYNLTDTFFLSGMGPSAIAAPGVIFPILLVIQSIAMMFAIGSGSLAARLLGQKKSEEANSIISTAFYVAIGVCSVFAVICLIFIDPIIKLCGATDSILPYARSYVFWIVLSTPFYSGFFVLDGVTKQEGNVLLTTISAAIGAVVNIILDYVFIFIFDMGIRGASIATSLAHILSFFILYVHIKSNKGVLKLKFKYCIFKFSMIKQIMKNGSSNLFQTVLMITSQLIMNNIMGSYGDIALANINVVNKISSMIVFTITGFGQGFQPMCGYCYGAKRYDRVINGLKFTITVCLSLIFVFATVAFFNAESIIRAFNPDGNMESINLGIKMLRAYLLAIPFGAITMISNVFFISCGKFVKSAIVICCKFGIVYIPVILLLQLIFGFNGVVFSRPVADFFTFLVSCSMLIFEYRRIKILVREEDKQ